MAKKSIATTSIDLVVNTAGVQQAISRVNGMMRGIGGRSGAGAGGPDGGRFSAGISPVGYAFDGGGGAGAAAAAAFGAALGNGRFRDIDAIKMERIRSGASKREIFGAYSSLRPQARGIGLTSRNMARRTALFNNLAGAGRGLFPQYGAEEQTRTTDLITDYTSGLKRQQELLAARNTAANRLRQMPNRVSRFGSNLASNLGSSLSATGFNPRMIAGGLGIGMGAMVISDMVNFNRNTQAQFRDISRFRGTTYENAAKNLQQMSAGLGKSLTIGEQFKLGLASGSGYLAKGISSISTSAGLLANMAGRYGDFMGPINVMADMITSGSELRRMMEGPTHIEKRFAEIYGQKARSQF